MIIQDQVKSFKKLTLKQIKEKVKNIKQQLPNDEKKVITYSKNFTLSLSNIVLINAYYRNVADSGITT